MWSVYRVADVVIVDKYKNKRRGAGEILNLHWNNKYDLEIIP